jgi:hypothetical protein
MKKNNDPFGFNKAVNYDKLDDPKMLKICMDIFGVKETVPTWDDEDIDSEDLVATIKKDGILRTEEE